MLRSRYGLANPEIAAAFSGLLEASELLFEDEASVEQALYLWKDSSAKFADCLTGARHWALEYRATATFDAKALRLPGFVACKPYCPGGQVSNSEKSKEKSTCSTFSRLVRRIH